MPTHPLSLTEIAARLEATGLAWGVFAGAAVYAYAHNRPVTDVDILVGLRTVDPLVPLFPEGGLHDKREVRVLAVGDVELVPDLPLTLQVAPDSRTVSFLFAMDEEMAARRVWRTGDDLAWPAAARLPVLAPEDNLVFKAILQRGREEGKHDLDDIHALISTLGSDLDWDYARRRAERCGALERASDCLIRFGVFL